MKILWAAIVVVALAVVYYRPRVELKTFFIWVRFKDGWREISCCFGKNRDSVNTEAIHTMYPGRSILVLDAYETPSLGQRV